MLHNNVLCRTEDFLCNLRYFRYHLELSIGHGGTFQTNTFSLVFPKKFYATIPFVRRESIK